MADSERSSGRRGAWEAVWTGGELEAEIVAGGLSAAGFKARVVPAGNPGVRHQVAFVPTLASVFVRGRDAERARQRLEEQGEGNNVVRGGAADTARDLGFLLKLSAWALVLAILAWLVVTLVREL